MAATSDGQWVEVRASWLDILLVVKMVMCWAESKAESKDIRLAVLTAKQLVLLLVAPMASRKVTMLA